MLLIEAAADRGKAQSDVSVKLSTRGVPSGKSRALSKSLTWKGLEEIGVT
jgi:hypothetical protein